MRPTRGPCFAQEANSIESAITADINEGHALVNGKWLVEVFAPRKLGAPWDRQRCRDEWINGAAASSGLAEVCDLWRRITGRPL